MSSDDTVELECGDRNLRFNVMRARRRCVRVAINLTKEFSLFSGVATGRCWREHILLPTRQGETTQG